MKNIDPKNFFLVTLAVWLIGAILSLATFVAIAFVAWHFISKFW
jgi:hypothetical protein